MFCDLFAHSRARTRGVMTMHESAWYMLCVFVCVWYMGRGFRCEPNRKSFAKPHRLNSVWLLLFGKANDPKRAEQFDISCLVFFN